MREEDVIELVIRHDSAIEHLAESLTQIAVSSQKQDEKLDVVLTVISQNAVILEKIANVDNTHKESVRLLNRRFDNDIKLWETASIALNTRITAISLKADKGNFIYDVIVAFAIAVPVAGALGTGLVWLISHYYKG